MNAPLPQTATFCADYAQRLQAVLAESDWTGVAALAEDLLRCWKIGNQVFLCGNGGSAGNAVHLANDFLYGISKTHGSGLRVHALSGSGNSPNILKALEQAKKMKVRTYAVLGYTGGKAKAMADVPIHFPVQDMQIAEDMQLVIGHMIMQWLYQNRPQA